MAGRAVIITGAAAGVGAACARKFASLKDRLLLADADEDGVKAIASELESAGAEVSFIHADVANRLQVHNIVAEAIDAFGRIDVLAHTVLTQFSAPFLETSEEDFDRIVTENIRGAFLINQAVAKQFVKQLDADNAPTFRGSIVNIGSIEAVTAAPDHVAFAASQGGLNQLTKAVAVALSAYGVRVNAVGVGAVKGEIGEQVEAKDLRAAIPLRRIGEPEEVAEVIAFLASEEASFVTGQCLYVDGGRLAQLGPAVSEED